MKIFSVAHFLNGPSSSESLFWVDRAVYHESLKPSLPCCDYTRKSVVQTKRAVATFVQRVSELYYQPELNTSSSSLKIPLCSKKYHDFQCRPHSCFVIVRLVSTVPYTMKACIRGKSEQLS